MMQCMTVNPMCLSSALRHHRENAWLPSGSSSIAPSLLPAEDLQWLKSSASWRPYRDNWEFRDFMQRFGLMSVEPAPDHKGNPRIWLCLEAPTHSVEYSGRVTSQNYMRFHLRNNLDWSGNTARLFLPQSHWTMRHSWGIFMILCWHQSFSKSWSAVQTASLSRTAWWEGPQQSHLTDRTHHT